MTRPKTVLLFVQALILAAAAEPPGKVFRFEPEFVASAFRAFSENVAVRWDDDYFYVESNSIPAHRMMVGIRAWNQQVPIPQPYVGDNSFRFPLRPRFADKPVSGRETLFRGAIAVAANGVPIFNPIKQDGRTDTYLAGELDEFGGHAGRADDYHYHVAPVHLSERAGAGSPVAWALDGFPVFGVDEPDGAEVEGLDWLNGHSHDEGPYHYHATPDYPRLNGGFRGQVALRNGEVAAQPRARAVRPFTRPLRGATVTGFEATGPGSFRLEFELRGQAHAVAYELLPGGGAEFVYSDGATQTRSERYPARRRGEREGQPRARRTGPRGQPARGNRRDPR